MENKVKHIGKLNLWIWISFLFLGFLLARSFLIAKYVVVSVEAKDLLQTKKDYVGYQVKKVDNQDNPYSPFYQLTPGEGENAFYLDLTGRDTDEIMLNFAEVTKTNVKVSYSLCDEKRESVTDEMTATWEANTKEVVLPHEKLSSKYIKISIPANVTLKSVYFALHSSNRKNIVLAWGGSFGLAVLLSLLFTFVESFKRKIEKLFLRIAGVPTYIRERKKRFLQLLFGVGISLALAGLVTGILAAMKVGKDLYGAFIVLSAAFFILAFLFVMRDCMGRHLAGIAAVCLLIVGLTYGFLLPKSVGMIWDDQIHYRNAFNLSHVLDHRECVAEFSMYANTIVTEKEYSREYQKENADYLNFLYEKGYCDFVVPSVKEPMMVAYIPAAAGIAFARSLGLSYMAGFFMGRLFNFLFYVLFLYLAMKHLKSGKLIILMLGLLPTNLMLATNYSYDFWLTALAFYGMAVCFGEMQRPEEKMSGRNAFMIAATLFLANLPKKVYFALLFFPMFLSNKKFSSKKKAWIYRATLVILMVLPFVSAYMGNIVNSSTATDVRGGSGVSAASQLDAFKADPMGGLSVLLRFLSTFLNPVLGWKSASVSMAYLGNVMQNHIVPIVFIIFAFLLRDAKEEKKAFPWWYRVGTVAVYAGIGFIVAFSLYITFTPVGSDTVAGVQPRYLMPVIFPLLFVLSRFRGKTWVKDAIGESHLHQIVIIAFAGLGLYGMWNNLLMYL